MSHEENNRASGSLSLRWVHVIVLLLVQTLLIGSIYGSLKYQVEENTRRIQKLEDGNITPGQFNEMQRDIDRRLSSIERKLDSLEKK